jgi:hypothetical protein
MISLATLPIARDKAEHLAARLPVSIEAHIEVYAMKVYLVCDIITDREMGDLLGYDPAIACLSLDKAKALAETSAQGRSATWHANWQSEWRPNEDGHLTLYVRWDEKRRKQNSGMVERRTSGIFVATDEAWEWVTQSERADCVIVEMDAD